MIQLALADPAYRSALQSLLERDAATSICCVENPDPAVAGVLVLDTEHLRRMPLPIRSPERIVLVVGNRSDDLTTAWNAGLKCVVFREDPIGTAALAVLCAGLQTSEATRSGRRRHTHRLSTGFSSQ